MNANLINQATFLEIYRIDEESFKKTLYTWDELSEIYQDYINEIPKLEDSATYIFQSLMKIKGIHSVRYRVKDPEHLIEKIIRKKIEKPELDKLNVYSYKERVTDLIGLRALHLFKEDWLPIHTEICSYWDFKEKPVANYRLGDSDEHIQWFIENGFEKKEHKFGYRSIHYIIETKPTKQIYYAEVQVRTIFEEAWSEIDHTVRYPYDQNNVVFGQFLMILNRLAGSADEMGTFIQLLKKSHLEKDSKHKQEIENRDQIINDLKNKIKSSKIKKEDQESMFRSLQDLKPTNYLSLFEVEEPTSNIVFREAAKISNLLDRFQASPTLSRMEDFIDFSGRLSKPSNNIYRGQTFLEHTLLYYPNIGQLHKCLN